jgi:hypothetical protein
MIRVTKAEVKEALEKNLESKEYCICRNCHYAFRITDEERKEYLDLRCSNCSTKYFYYASYGEGLVDSIIDPEPIINTYDRMCDTPQEQYGLGYEPSMTFGTVDEANKYADEQAALPSNHGKKVLVLKVINTRIARIEYERS